MNCTCNNPACKVRMARNLKPFCDRTLSATSSPRGMTESEARAAAKPGQGVVCIRPNFGHSPPRWIIRGKARA